MTSIMTHTSWRRYCGAFALVVTLVTAQLVEAPLATLAATPVVSLSPASGVTGSSLNSSLSGFTTGYYWYEYISYNGAGGVTAVADGVIDGSPIPFVVPHYKTVPGTMTITFKENNPSSGFDSVQASAHFSVTGTGNFDMTPTPTFIPTQVGVIATNTPTSTATPTATPTSTPTFTPIATAKPTVTATPKPPVVHAKAAHLVFAKVGVVIVHPKGSKHSVYLLSVVGPAGSVFTIGFSGFHARQKVVLKAGSSVLASASAVPVGYVVLRAKIPKKMKSGVYLLSIVSLGKKNTIGQLTIPGRHKALKTRNVRRKQ